MLRPPEAVARHRHPYDKTAESYEAAVALASLLMRAWQLTTEPRAASGCSWRKALPMPHVSEVEVYPAIRRDHGGGMKRPADLRPPHLDSAAFDQRPRRHTLSRGQLLVSL
ncbi:hypothetical protein Sdia_37700 [Streptomyces diastaticus subsp. diastaticus]|uniref:Uncharacterized protein n=1 Tax=Streptomyces diastaticus subsp. diastaticus TaxID=68040 RepID=A0ABQ1CRJ2_STRDI|nr:hypothetical protein Sdia_37700 [Streptomyces diastaticus subsp. diastaticus]GGU25836.1 hypothetical protein GCM10015534_30600 [Streptomyces diastaticus subsp. diastaticus]